MIRGGIADKLGNRYEAKWLVRMALEVLDGKKADWFLFEGVASTFRGFEFAIGRKEITEWHQTKINSPQGNWTIKALATEGILKAFANRLSADKHARCFFVSQDNAKDFRTLTEKAQLFNSVDQYLDNLSEKQEESFRQVQQAWNPPGKTIFDWLKRTRKRDSLNELFVGLEEQNETYFPQGNWMINAQKREDSINVTAILSLINRAQFTGSVDEYLNSLAKEEKEPFRQLQQAWNPSEEVMLDWLKRSRVEIIPERELDSFNESYGDLYFHQGGKSAFPNLRDLL
ncbi:MAG: hypothetical protein D3904_09375, partial [Candidatus Electrothrix sp. EH2]|nr:hypothetical protein [Candidatus Electrothrix sp. EH2]